MSRFGIRHVGIFTDKPDEMIDFYEWCLHFKKVWDKEENVRDITGLDLILRTVKLSHCNGTQIELLIPKKSLGVRRQCYDDGGITHIAITVSDMDSIYDDCKNRGLDMLTGKVFVSSVGRKIFFVRDPDGNVLELVQDPLEE